MPPKPYKNKIINQRNKKNKKKFINYANMIYSLRFDMIHVL